MHYTHALTCLHINIAARMRRVLFMETKHAHVTAFRVPFRGSWSVFMYDDDDDDANDVSVRLARMREHLSPTLRHVVALPFNLTRASVLRWARVENESQGGCTTATGCVCRSVGLYAII